MEKEEWKYAVGWGLAVLLLTCVPYFVVWWSTPLQAVFPLVLYSSDDQAVYFSWMKQAQDGAWLLRNLFTTEPQRGAYFHCYFLLLGWLSRVPALGIPGAYHLGRIVAGMVVLLLAYRLGAQFHPDRFYRRTVFWTVALSAGLGWLFWRDEVLTNEPVDVWQPEALTFASLYTNSLFAVSLALMLGVVLCLLLAEERGARWAVGAGLCGLALGNVHSYDMIHLAAVWTLYLLLRWGTERRWPARAVGMALLAALVASPSVAYMAWLYLSEPVFRARADTETLTPGVDRYLLGYGLLAPLAVWGALLVWRSWGEEEAGPRAARCLLPAWTIAGAAVIYAPFAFQRKMVMGLHFPIAILAGLAVAELARRVGAGGRLRPGVVAAGVVGALAISSLRFLARDVRVAREQGTTSTRIHPVYWDESQIHGFEWLGRATTPDSSLMAFPWSGILAPAYSGRRVFAGHWGESPRFGDRLQEAWEFYWGEMSSSERREFLRRNGITHVLDSRLDRSFVQLRSGRTQAPFRPVGTEPFLAPVFQEGETVIYAFRPESSP